MKSSTDHRPGAQGLLAAGHSSAWHRAQASHSALAQAQWKRRKPNNEVLTPGAQSMPNGGRIFWDRQPRMPWQDVEVRIEGPSVYDLTMNFIRRWNSLQAKLGPEIARKATIGDALFPQRPSEGEGNGGQGGMKVDVLRSAPVQLQNDEAKGTAGLKQAAGPQREIHDAIECGAVHLHREPVLSEWIWKAID